MDRRTPSDARRAMPSPPSSPRSAIALLMTLRRKFVCEWHSSVAEMKAVAVLQSHVAPKGVKPSNHPQWPPRFVCRMMRFLFVAAISCHSDVRICTTGSSSAWMMSVVTAILSMAEMAVLSR